MSCVNLYGRPVIREFQADDGVTYRCILHYVRPTGRAGRVYGYGDTVREAFDNAVETASNILSRWRKGPLNS